MALSQLTSKLNTQQLKVGLAGPYGQRFALGLILILIVYVPARHGFWPLSVLLAVSFEGFRWQRSKNATVEQVILPISMAVGMAVVAAASPKALTQLVVALMYAIWRDRYQAGNGIYALTALGAWLEACYLAAAIWQTPASLILLGVWLGSFMITFSYLKARGERAAVLLAAIWALVATQIGWLFTVWLVAYVATAGYLVVPQPVLVLSAVAYCFGGIYIAQRQNRLNRARLAEYMIIAAVVVGVVVAGTSWRGSV